MPTFGKSSEKQLATCHPELQRLLREAIKYIDFTVTEGFRGKEAQNAAYAKGFSQKKWPDGNHNKNPSLAADIAPYPVDWSDKTRSVARFAMVQGCILTCAKDLGIKVRLGIDFNGNGDIRDDGFWDPPHVEIVL